MIRTPVFFNVLGGSIFTSFNQASDDEFKSGAVANYAGSPRWYSKSADPYFYEPYVLVSSAHYSGIPDLRAKMKADDDTIIFIDSGGYQLATGVKPNHSREKALEWSEANGDLFPILDLPANKKISMDESIAYTIESAKYYSEKRSRSDCIIMNVLSATERSGMERWYKAVKDFQFDGWAYGGHANSLKSIIQSILFLESKGELSRNECTNLHIFGTTSLHVIPYLVYAQNILNKKGINCLLSFDSSYAFRNAGFGKYFIFESFKGMGALVLSNKYDWSGLTESSHFGCSCPVCSNITDVGALFDGSAGSHFYSIIGMHNYYKLLQYKRTIEGMLSVNVPEIINSLPKDILHNFNVMDKAFDKGGNLGMDVISTEMKTSSNSKSTVSKKLSAFF